jgi:hypothetical protein
MAEGEDMTGEIGMIMTGVRDMTRTEVSGMIGTGTGTEIVIGTEIGTEIVTGIGIGIGTTEMMKEDKPSVSRKRIKPFCRIGARADRTFLANELMNELDGAFPMLRPE